MDRWDRLIIHGESHRPTLLKNESELLLIPKVALYDGEVQVSHCQDGSLSLTNHRILWRDSNGPVENSLSLSLSLVSRHTFKAGFLTSSPKITLFLLPKSHQSPLHPQSIPHDNNLEKSSNWECSICSQQNTLETYKCTTCGVPRRPSEKGMASNSQNSKWKCTICTFLNQSLNDRCGMCGCPPRPERNDNRSSPPIVVGETNSTSCLLPSPSPSSSSSSTTTKREDYIRLSFRGGGSPSSNFLAHLKMVLQKQEWRISEVKDRTFDPTTTIGGVTGLLRKVQVSQERANENLDEAFEDLESLMNKASDMVQLADKIMTKLTNKFDNVDENSELEFRNLVSELGVVGSVITKGTAGGSFHTELSRELADFALRLLERRKSPILPLSDLYCLYNRARGANLVSPNDLFIAVTLFESLSLPVRLERLTTANGLLVVQASAQSEQVILKRILESLKNQKEECLDAFTVSRNENVSLSIALFYLCKAEGVGLLCRDESPSGIRYYPNLFA